jgi:hypothetical protein
VLDLLTKVVDLTCRSLVHRLVDARVYTRRRSIRQCLGMRLLECFELLLGGLVPPFVGDHRSAPRSMATMPIGPLVFLSNWKK